MRSRKEDCDLCGGSRHVFSKDKSKWVKCECAKVTQSKKRYAKAGVGARFKEETWQTFFKGYKVNGGKSLIRFAAKLKLEQEVDEWFMVTGRPSRARDLVATLILRTAVDNGRDAVTTSVSDLVQAEFGRAEERTDDVEKAELIVLYAGGEPKHSYNKHAVEKLIRRAYARKQAVILIAEATPSELKKYYKSGIVQEALSSSFGRIHVDAKETE